MLPPQGQGSRKHVGNRQSRTAEHEGRQFPQRGLVATERTRGQLGLTTTSPATWHGCGVQSENGNEYGPVWSSKSTTQKKQVPSGSLCTKSNTVKHRKQHRELCADSPFRVDFGRRRRKNPCGAFKWWLVTGGMKGNPGKKGYPIFCLI